MLFGEGPAQDRQARGAFAEPVESGRKGVRIERGNRRLLWLDAGPVCVKGRLVHVPMIAVPCRAGMIALQMALAPGTGLAAG